MKIRGVIFDLDGTLVDTEGLHLSAWNQAALELGSEKGITAEEYSNYVGKDSNDIVRAIINSHPEIAEDAKTIVETKKKLLRENLFEVTLIEGAMEALKRCQELGLRMAIATGGNQPDTDHLLRTNNIDEYFDAVVTADDVRNYKPHPQTYLEALAGLDLTKQEAIAIEDTQSGVCSAVDARLYTIAKPTPATQAQDFSRANVVVNTLSEAIAHIESLINS